MSQMTPQFDTNKKIEAVPEITVVSPESKIENLSEKKFELMPRPAEKPEISSSSAVPATPAQGLDVEIAEEHKKQIKEIENVLAEGLEESYVAMSPDQKRHFKKLGEETAKQIYSLLNEVKVNVKKILKLIINWLSYIPGVNKFFLEQEAKIKTDKILQSKNNF